MPAEEPDSFDPHAWEPPSPDHIAVLLPQYDVEALIGRGGMGAVYKAVHTKLKRPVAIKVLPAELAQTEQEAFVARFQREAQLLASLNHPGIVTIYDFGQMAGGSLYFVMEFVDGTDLNCLIRDKKLPPAEALKLAMQICEALQFAHDNGVIHRDIKPANVLVTRDGRAKLADFGLALRPTDAAEQAPVIPLPQGVDADAHHREMAAMRYTRVGFVMGTPPYAAPEVYAGVADERSDIFALGIMLYEMLTGRPPEDGYLLPSQKVGVDRRVDKVVIKALEGDPDARFQKASEVKEAVENATKPLSTALTLTAAPVQVIPPQSRALTTSPQSLRQQQAFAAQRARHQGASQAPKQSGCLGKIFTLASLALIALIAAIAFDAGQHWAAARRLIWALGFTPERKTTERIEGEALKVLQVTGGEVETQPMKQTNALWSGDAHLWWHGGAAGYSLDLEFTVEEGQAGKQRLKAAFTSSSDYGTVELSLDGKKLKGSIFDLQANGAVISGARDLGLHDLAAGPHVLRIGILDTSVINMDKRDAYSVGLDYLQLDPPILEEAPAAPGTDIALKAQPSASHCSPTNHVNVMNDGKTFANDLSFDESRRRHSWWPHFGTAEWAQYEWSSPQSIQECHVLWYSNITDPRTPNSCGLPVFWRILYREESSGAWVPVDAKIPAATRDALNRVKFTPVRTSALRISVQCPEPQTVGIYAWKVLAADPVSMPDAKTREHPDLFLGDLSPLHAQVGSEAYRMNSLTASAIRDNVVVMGNRMPCGQFLWAHADSRLDFGIPEGYTRFTAYGVGYADPRTGQPVGLTDWNYTVLVDGRVVEKSNVLTTYKDKQFAVDVTFPIGSKVLSLLTGTNGSGYGDHAHWAYPTLLAASQPGVSAPPPGSSSSIRDSSVSAGQHAPVPPVGNAAALSIPTADAKPPFIPSSSHPSVTPGQTLPPEAPNPVTQRLAELESQFRAACDREAARMVQEDIAALDKSYLASGFPRAIADAQRRSDGVASVALEKERDAYLASKAVPATDAPGTHEAVIALRKTYRDARVKIESSLKQKPVPDALYEVYLTALTKYQNEISGAESSRVLQRRREVAAKAGFSTVSSDLLPAEWQARCRPAGRLQRLQQTGGTPHDESAVSGAFEYLKGHQNTDGSWGTEDQATTTGLVLLAYLGRCEGLDSIYYAEAVMRGALFLMETAKKNPQGIFAVDPRNPLAANAHGIATCALGELYVMSRQGAKTLPGLREAFEKGVAAIVQHQLPEGGWAGQDKGSGFRLPGQGNCSLFTTACQALAIDAAIRSGLKLPGLHAARDRAVGYVPTTQKADGSFGINPAALTGLSIWTLQTLGKGQHATIKKGLSSILERYQRQPPTWGGSELYAWWFESQALFHGGGESLRLWREKMFPQVLKNQSPDGHWSPPPGHRGGDSSSTALGILMLESAYRDVPVPKGQGSR